MFARKWLNSSVFLYLARILVFNLYLLFINVSKNDYEHKNVSQNDYEHKKLMFKFKTFFCIDKLKMFQLRAFWLVKVIKRKVIFTENLNNQLRNIQKMNWNYNRLCIILGVQTCFKFYFKFELKSKIFVCKHKISFTYKSSFFVN